MASVSLALWLLLLLLPGCSIGGLGIDGVGGTPQSTPPSSQSEQAVAMAPIARAAMTTFAVLNIL